MLGAKAADKVEVESDAKKTVQSTKPADKPEAEVKTKKSDTVVNFSKNLIFVVKPWFGTKESMLSHLVL